jgi:hypothetical protein
LSFTRDDCPTSCLPICAPVRPSFVGFALTAGYLAVDLGLLAIRFGPFAINPSLQAVDLQAGALEGFPRSHERRPTSR